LTDHAIASHDWRDDLDRGDNRRKMREGIFPRRSGPKLP
jgi:hypothetical protein